MTKEQKMAVVEKCIEMLPEHGSIRVGYVCKEILQFPTNELKVSAFRSISALIIRDNRYIREAIHVGAVVADYDILDNPNFQFHEDVKATNGSV